MDAVRMCRHKSQTVGVTYRRNMLRRIKKRLRNNRTSECDAQPGQQ